ncbi:hypothetical protein PUN28_003545 [Cardiocondyla obscurior]
MSISIDTIEIYNFKSYLGKIIIGPLCPFTAIIGSNGSGKSNIMDAIRFALGDKLSALRVKCLGELIYGYNTDKGPVKDVTYVKLILKIVDKIKDEVTKRNFIRKIYNNKTYYYIDDKIVTYTIYITELQNIGLNLKTQSFFVSQGCIEHFAMKSPKELTAIFEEISDSIMYKTDYENLKLKLLSAEEEVFFQHQIKKVKLNEKKYALMEKAEENKYLQLEKQYNEDKLKYQLIQLVFIKNEFESLQNKMLKIKSQLDRHQQAKEIAGLEHETLISHLKPLSNGVQNMEEAIFEKENVLERKKKNHIILKDSKSYWQKKCDFARISLDNANKACDINKKVIQELKDELQQINLQLTELRNVSQTSIELSNSQIDRYTKLTCEVQHQAKDFVKEKNNLLHDDEPDKDKLNNKNRCKKELEDKIKLMRLTEENHEMRLKKLQDLNKQINITLTEKKAKLHELNEKIIETRDKSLSLENDIAPISKNLSQADLDNDIVLQQIRNDETITTLKQLYSDVYGRLSDLCKPIHSRYNVAVTKVFGKHMNAIVVGTNPTAIQCIQFLKQNKKSREIFLPLDSIKNVHLKTYLRDIEEPRNVKLLYDVISSKLPQFEKVILFVTKNTLVCESPEDARMIAFESQRANDCVSLDGCFYRKDGTMSGGQTDLNIKAKQWQEREILSLIKQKEQLMQEFRKLPNISLMESDVAIINTEVDSFNLRKKFIKTDLNNVENDLVKIRKELDKLDGQLILLNMEISEIQDNIKKRAINIKKVENNINAIKNEIFVEFCKDINVPDIEYYEKNNLRNYKEHERKKREFEEQYDRIENQLEIENKTDTESNVLKWTLAVKKATTEFNKLHKQECQTTFKIERIETDLLELKRNYMVMKKDVENMEKELNDNTSRIDVLEKSYLECHKSYIALFEKIKEIRRKCNTILHECKIENLVIPMSETSYNESEDTFSTSFISTSSNFEALFDCNVLKKIDFSHFPENICRSTENDLRSMAEQLHKELAKNRSEIAAIANPNLKVNDSKIIKISEEIREVNRNLRNCRNKYEEIKTQFESLKKERCKQFLDCLNYVAVELNAIYQKLVKNTLAQAIILTDNLEEPYAGNIIYNCVAPFKGLRSLEYLSGAEKSLASLALLFAIQRYKKISFFIMDEGDAALDPNNVRNVVDFIASEKNVMQFITISLNRKLFSKADMLVGVTTQRYSENVRSKVFGLTLHKYAEEN